MSFTLTLTLTLINRPTPAQLLVRDSLCRPQVCWRIDQAAALLLPQQHHRLHHPAGSDEEVRSEEHCKLLQFDAHVVSRVIYFVCFHLALLTCPHAQVFSSSATVYGDPVKLPIDESHPVSPSTHTHINTHSHIIFTPPQLLLSLLTQQHFPKFQVGSCTNPYGKTKYFIEEILRDLAKAEPVKITDNRLPHRLAFFVIASSHA